MKIEVIEIYPRDSTDKYIERGSVHIFLEDWNIDIKNIPYYISEDKRKNSLVYHAHVSYPFYYYHQNSEDSAVKTTRVPTISFRDEQVWHQIKKVIREELLRRFNKK